LAVALQLDDAVVSVVEPALHVGMAQILEGCFCRLGGESGEEIVKVGRLHKECEVALPESIEADAAWMRVSDQQLQLLDMLPGAALLIGQEIICLKKVRMQGSGPLLFVARGQCGTKVQAHARGAKAKRLVSHVWVEVCGSASRRGCG
jgi:hypothetical protein